MSYKSFFSKYEPIQTSFVIEDPDSEKVIDDSYFQLGYIDDTASLEDTEVTQSNDLEQIEQAVETGELKLKTPTKIKTSSLGEKIVNTARQFIGTLYKWGGNNPSTGFDCSGLIQYAYKQNGITLPRVSHDMGKSGIQVSLNNVKPGDIIYTGSSGPSGGHVKMVSKIENGKIYVIEASGRGKPVKEHELTKTNNIRSIRRIIDYAKYGKKLICRKRYI